MPMTAWRSYRLASISGHQARGCRPADRAGPSVLRAPLCVSKQERNIHMNSLKPVFTMFHAAAGLKRLLIAVLAVLLLGVFTALPALASGSCACRLHCLQLCFWERS